MVALQDRTKEFAIRIIRFVESLPPGHTSKAIGNQRLRAGPSVGANYRAAHRAKSTPHFSSKMGDVEEECDECIYWMELAIEAGLVKATRLKDLMTEANELLSITVAFINTAKKRLKKKLVPLSTLRSVPRFPSPIPHSDLRVPR